MQRTHSTGGQFELLSTRRFAPFFWTQIWGAFNDNLFKAALTVVLVLRSGGNTNSTLLVMAAGLFILPFLLFSGLAGRMADRFEKSGLIRRLKTAEIVIMGCAAPALMLDQTWLLIGLLFAMGTQSAFFGPVKYSLLPVHLEPEELVGGNGLVEMGTFAAVLLGSLGGSLLAAAGHGQYWVAAAVVTAAVLGRLASRRIPPAPSAAPDLTVQWQPLRDSINALRLIRRDRTITWGVLGISWFWLVGSAYVTQLPHYTRRVLDLAPTAIGLLLAAFLVGIGIGAISCERLSGRRLALGLVPLGALLMGIAGWHLAMAERCPHAVASGLAWAASAPGLRVLIDLLLIGAGGGLYIVPLFVLVQQRTPAEIRSRVIAGNNVVNALAMIGAALAAMLLLGVAGLRIETFFGLLAAANLLAAAIACWRAPLSIVRLTVQGLLRVMYRLRCRDLTCIPDSGPAVLVCNHVTYVDALIIAAACHRPVRFVMHNDYYRLPGLKWLFRLAGAIPIDSGRRNPALLHHAFSEMIATLKAGGLIALFPEGRLTRSGQIDIFRPGIEQILRRAPVPVVPLALRGLWGSIFSHKHGPALRQWPRRFRSRIELVAGPALAADQVTAQALRAQVSNLRGAWA